MTTFRSGFSRVFLVALAVSLASTTALAANTPTAPTTPPNDAHRAHNEGPGEHHGHRRGIHHLLEGIQLRPEQRDAVMRLHREAMNDRVVVENATKPYRNELAKELRAGSFDRVILERLLAASAQDLGTLPPVHVQMLAKLHVILDPAQRTQVADKLSKMPPMMGPGEHPGGGGKAQGRGRGHGPNGEHGPGGHAFFHKFTEDLDLTPSQRDAIAKAIHERMTAEKSGDEHAAMRAEMEARSKDLAERFRKDTFVVTDADNMPISMAAKHLGHLGDFTMVAAPILTVNQRQKLADHIEQGRHDLDEP